MKTKTNTNTNTNSMKNNTQNISYFNSLANSSLPTTTVTVESCLELIKNNPFHSEITKARSLGKYDTDLSFEKYDKNKKKNVPTNYYDWLKSTKCPAVTWNTDLEGDRRRLSNVNTSRLSKYRYCDIDTFDKIIKDPSNSVKTEAEAFDYVRKILTSSGLKFIKAVWSSYGGKGFGFLVEIEGLTKENSTSTWMSLKEMFDSNWGLTFDVATKDITRLNVLSSDPEIFIREDGKIIPYVAVEPEQTVVVERAPQGTFSIEGSDIHKKMYEITCNAKGAYVEGNRCPFTVCYAGLMNQYGVELEDTLAQILEVHPEFNESRVRDTYNRYTYEFGTLDFDEEFKSVSEEIEVKEENIHVIPEGKYLSDVTNVSEIYGKYLIAQAGVGKSHLMFGSKEKTIAVVPFQSLCRNIQADFPEYDVFFHKNKTLREGCTKYITTYPSLVKLLPLIGDLSSYNLVLDESHNFVTSTSRDFALDQYTSAIVSIMKHNFKSITMMSATPKKSSRPFFNTFEKIQFIKAGESKLSIQIDTPKDPSKFKKDLLERVKDGKRYVTMFLNSTGSALDRDLSISKLAGINMSSFNSKNKHEALCQQLLTSGNIPKNMDAFISTTVFSEGVSLYLGDERNEVLDIIVNSAFHPLEIYQNSDRIRDAKKINIHVLKKHGFKDTKMKFNSGKETQRLLDLAQIALNFNNSLISKGFNPSNSGYVEGLEETYLNFSNGRFEIDYELIDNTVYKLETKAANKDVSFFKTLCEKYGMEFKGIFDHSEELDGTSTDIIKQEVENKAIEREIKQELLEEEIETQGQAVNQTILDNDDMKNDSNEKFTRTKYARVWALNNNDDEKTFEMYHKIGQGTAKWKAFKMSVHVEQILQGVKGTKADKAVLEELKNTFKEGDSFTNTEIKDLYNNIVNKYRKTDIVSYTLNGSKVETKKVSRKKIKLSTNKAVSLLKTIVKLDRKNVRISEEIEVNKEEEVEINGVLTTQIVQEEINGEMVNVKEIKTIKKIVKRYFVNPERLIPIDFTSKSEEKQFSFTNNL